MTSTGPLPDDTHEERDRPVAAAAQVSVLIVNYQAYEELDRCLASLAEDVSHGHEVVVVDHASTGRCAGLAARYPAVRFAPSDRNPGFAAGVNAAARLASGAWLLLLNPDTLVQPGAVDAMQRYMAASRGVGAVGARVLDPDGSLQRSGRRFPTMVTGLFGRTTLMSRLWPGNPLTRRDLPADESTTTPLVVDWVAGSCVMVRRDAFEAIGGMDERFFLYWEDADLCRRLADAGWSTVYLPDAVVTHLVARSSRHARRASIRAFHRSAFQYMAKHTRGRFGRLALPLVWILLNARMAMKLVSSRGERSLAGGAAHDEREDLA